MLEEDLFQPVSDFLVRAGYQVRSEVSHCDIMAIKGDELLVVELKKVLGLALLVQAVKRQKSADTVYMAVPKPTSFTRSKKWTDTFHLIRRLELGLMFVNVEKKGAGVEVVIEALPFDRERSRQQYKKKRIASIAEMNGRHKDYNKGGSTRKKLVTAYRESCIGIAVCLREYGPLSPKELTQYGADPKKTGSMLRSNFYGWFDHLEKGVYGLTDNGRKELSEYRELARYYKSFAAKTYDSNNVSEAQQ